MNWCLVALGIAGIVGGAVHACLGERKIIALLDPSRLPSSFLGDGDISKRYLRWFWHVGTIAIAGPAALLVAIGTGFVADRSSLLVAIVGGQYALMFLTFLVVALPRRDVFRQIPQGSLIGIGSLLVWAGAMIDC